MILLQANITALCGEPEWLVAFSMHSSFAATVQLSSQCAIDCALMHCVVCMSTFASRQTPNTVLDESRYVQKGNAKDLLHYSYKIALQRTNYKRQTYLCSPKSHGSLIDGKIRDGMDPLAGREPANVKLVQASLKERTQDLDQNNAKIRNVSPSYFFCTIRDELHNSTTLHTQCTTPSDANAC